MSDYFKDKLMIKDKAAALSRADKYKVVDTFVRKMIEANMLNIFCKDNSIDYDKLGRIDEMKMIFDKYELVESKFIVEEY